MKLQLLSYFEIGWSIKSKFWHHRLSGKLSYPSMRKCKLEAPDFLTNIIYHTRANISHGLYLFFTLFSLWLPPILQTIYVLKIEILHFLSSKSMAYEHERLQIESGLWWRPYGTNNKVLIHTIYIMSKYQFKWDFDDIQNTLESRKSWGWRRLRRRAQDLVP